jgi:hypothetical protein
MALEDREGGDTDEEGVEDVDEDEDEDWADSLIASDDWQSKMRQSLITGLLEIRTVRTME